MHTIKRQIHPKNMWKLFHDPYSISLSLWTFPSTYLNLHHFHRQKKKTAPWQSPTRLGSKTWCFSQTTKRSTKGWKIWRPKMTGKKYCKTERQEYWTHFFLIVTLLEKRKLVLHSNTSQKVTAGWSTECQEHLFESKLFHRCFKTKWDTKCWHPSPSLFSGRHHLQTFFPAWKGLLLKELL